MSKTFTDSVQYLTEAKEALAQLNQAKAAQPDLELKEKQQAKTLASEKKTVEDSVNATVRKRRDELEASYNKELSKVQDAVKKVQSQRARAKQQGMKERIAAQLEPYREENRQMKDKIKKSLKDDGAPAICNTTLYYALYFPRAVTEVFLMLAVFVICFIAVPLGIYELILPEQKSIWLALIYVVVIVVFGGLYLLIGSRTKTHHAAAIKEAQKVRRAIAKNKKKMRSVTRSIRREKSEEHYDLAEFDRQLDEKQKEREEIQQKKDAAVSYFESTTKPAITEEIVSASREKIDALEAEHNETLEKIKESEAFVKQATLSLSDDYESYIGKEFMSDEILTALINYLQSGEAKTITEAENCWRAAQTAKKDQTAPAAQK